MKTPKLLFYLASYLLLPSLGLADSAQIELTNCTLLNNTSKHEQNRKFTQRRFIKGFNKPIVSSGSMLVEKNSLSWITTEPFYSRVNISEEGFIVEANEAGLREQYNSSRFKEIAKIILKAHHPAKLIELKEDFNVSCSKDGAKFRILAAPKSKKLSRFLNSIELIGLNRPNLIRIKDERGDTTEIDLLD